MKTLIFILLATAGVCISSIVHGQSCDPNQLINYQVKAKDTDNNIVWEILNHSTFYNPDCSPKNILLLHLVGTGDNPEESVLYPSLAANNGFHTICLKYKNAESGKSACGASLDQDCHYKWRKEIIEGQDYSTEVDIDSVESIYNRTYRLILHMETNFPTQGWGQFLNGNEVDWSKIIISGHSQGGGHAAVIAMDQEVQRIIMFASPNDYLDTLMMPAPWTSASHLTADSAYFSLNNLNDALIDYSVQFNAAVELGEDQFGDTVNVDYNSCPYNNSHNLYTDLDNVGIVHNHSSMIHDSYVPLNGSNEPIYLEAWKYLLGLNCDIVGNQESLWPSVKVYPNPTQGQLTIELDKPAEIFILSADGKIVLNRIVNKKEMLDMQGLDKGQYFLQIRTETGVQVKKIIAN